jgi:hypothetical protein
LALTVYTVKIVIGTSLAQLDLDSNFQSKQTEEVAVWTEVDKQKK